MNDELKKYQLRLLVLRRQFIFDRLLAFAFAIVGLLISAPFLMFLSGWFFLWTAFDVWRVGRLEKKISSIEPESTTSSQE